MTCMALGPFLVMRGVLWRYLQEISMSCRFVRKSLEMWLMGMRLTVMSVFLDLRLKGRVRSRMSLTVGGLE